MQYSKLGGGHFFSPLIVDVKYQTTTNWFKKKTSETIVKVDSEEDSLDNSKPRIWEDIGHHFAASELEELKRSITEMALSRINGNEELYVGGYVLAHLHIPRPSNARNVTLAARCPPNHLTLPFAVRRC